MRRPRPAGRRGGADGGRRALAPSGESIERQGDPEVARTLETALRATRRAPDRLTHGFHSYPARMHPDVARTLLERYAGPRTRVLDPFCGSGTVLVEAMVAGCRSTGVDLNPLAIRIARVHCTPRRREERRRFEQSLRIITEASLERVHQRVKVLAPLSPRERSYYDAHVLLELAGLREEIERVEPPDDREAMEIVFSALLVKFSRQRADTSDEVVQRRIRKGLTSEFFLRKGRELSQRWADLSRACPPGTPTPDLHVGDARDLDRLTRGEAPFDLVITSPPYGGTYDYVDHHARRYPWLGIDPRRFARDELGARRRFSHDHDAAARWDEEVTDALRSIARVCRSGARVALLVGDAELGGRSRVDAAEQLLRLAPDLGYRPVAVASHARPDFRHGPPRREHLALLEREGDRDARRVRRDAPHPRGRRDDPRR